ncbi:MAG: tetratricopeptide repeat protein [Planctomycetota bacterium]|nr:tetratricopeptide repeat protein [Planctomycetota bacterium]
MGDLPPNASDTPAGDRGHAELPPVPPDHDLPVQLRPKPGQRIRAGTFTHGLVLASIGRWDAAIRVLKEVLLANPDDGEACEVMGECLCALKRPQHALVFARKAAQLLPDKPSVAALIGWCLFVGGKIEEAGRHLRASVEKFPNDPIVRYYCAEWHAEGGLISRAIAECEAGLALAPDNDRLLTCRANLHYHSARMEEAMPILKRLAAEHSATPSHLSSLAMLCNYDPDASAEEIFEHHNRFGLLMDMQAPAHAGPWMGTKDPERPLRVAIMSPDLRTHSVAYFAEAVFRGLDQSQFHITVLNTGSIKPDDAMQQRFRSLAQDWWEITALPDEVVGQRLMDGRIDILIDLAGHTSGGRLKLLQYKPVPVIVSMIGYPNTLGLASVTARIVDSLTDPAEPDGQGSTPDELAVERLLRLDPAFLCYTPPDPLPPIGLTPEGWDAPVTFGSFNHTAKINNRVLDAWAELLRRVEGSRLILKAPALSDPGIARDLGERLASRGVDPARFRVLTRTATPAEHLPLYQHVDIALDPFPYQGTTTTFEALLMGVPVVTLEGRTHAQRVGTSILTNVGAPELIARSLEEYLSIAQRLAADRPRLNQYRQNLRAMLLRSALCDQLAYGQRLGAALRGLWREYCAG